MHHPKLDTIVAVPWSDALPRRLAAEPARGDTVGIDTWSAPRLPLVRVDAQGQVGVLDFLDGDFVRPDSVGWGRADGSAIVWHRARDPFADRAAITAVDFTIGSDGSAIILETISSRTSRLIIAGVDGAGRGVELAGGPYVRLVADDRDRLYAVRHDGGPALIPIDRVTGDLGAAIAFVPGTPLALAANRGAVIPSALLDHPTDGRVAAPAELPAALVYLFGVDGRGDYYSRVDDQLVAVSFAGAIRARAPLGPLPELATPSAGALRPRLALLPAWQVDSAGRVYVARATADEFQVVRLTLAR